MQPAGDWEPPSVTHASAASHALPLLGLPLPPPLLPVQPAEKQGCGFAWCAICDACDEIGGGAAAVSLEMEAEEGQAMTGRPADHVLDVAPSKRHLSAGEEEEGGGGDPPAGHAAQQAGTAAPPPTQAMSKAS